MTPVRDLLEGLVAFDTITERGTVALIDFVATHLSAGGGTVRRIVGEDASRVSLVAQTPAAVAGAGVMFAGHADVVPTEGQAWNSDPFRLVERDGKLYGRGAADMKGFLAIVLSRFADWTARGIAVTLVITHDEEVSCRAVREVLAYMTEHNWPLPRACVVGEPTGLRPVDAHKSKLSFRCDVTGRECHSALAPEGVNAVEIAAELVVWLRARARRFAVDGPFDAAFSPPHTTLQTGILRGGTAVNIVPNRCSFEFDLRALPGVDGAAVVDELRSFADRRLLPEMKAVSADTDIRIVATANYAPLEPPPAPSLARLLERLTGVRPEKVGFATEAGFYQQAGIDTVVCGPGSIAQAHRPDEFVEKEHLERCGTIVDQVASHYSQ